ncbi:MAG: Type 1 glutamine amidotransferase-like domain-containing protein [Chloroflexi bacterium]|nr:Type 1 glutamine amidotransferase-like domain-containing protein [Chloroflexota bacterium]
MPGPGPIALVGSGEFLPAMSEIDAALLAGAARRRPRVAILPTASWPDGEEVFRRWASMGVEHFAALGAEVEPVLVRDRFDAEDRAHVQAIGEADLIYLSGGKPGHLTETLVGSPVGAALVAAHRRGATLVGCSAGAMALAARHWDVRKRRMFWPLRWRDALGLVPGVTVIPHYNAFPEPMAAMVVLQAPRGLATLGVDEDTALVGRDGSWQVQGAGRVTVWTGRQRERFRRGDVIRL